METRPLFVGVIPDKNRTWTKQKYATEKPTFDQLRAGYLRGGEVIKDISTVARDSCVDIIAHWGMSDDNMSKRSPGERQILYEVFEYFLRDLKETWMDLPENSSVRFVHMGRTDRLSAEAPRVIELIEDITASTRDRTGMTMAVCLDYGGLDEQERAEKLWLDSDGGKEVGGWKQHLDLPRQGVSFRPADLIIRTGQKAGETIRTNEFLWSYLQETRVIPRECYLPDYSGAFFEDDLQKFRAEKQNRGA